MAVEMAREWAAGSELLIAAVGGGAIVAAGVWLFGRLSARDGLRRAENKEQLSPCVLTCAPRTRLSTDFKRVGGNDARGGSFWGWQGGSWRYGESVADGEAPRVWNFVLTGGPCAGKSTALAREILPPKPRLRRYVSRVGHLFAQ